MPTDIDLPALMGQVHAFQQTIDELGAGKPFNPVEWDRPGLGIHLRVTFDRHARARCSTCQHRRVLYSVGLGEFQRGPKLCAKCAGIR